MDGIDTILWGTFGWGFGPSLLAVLVLTPLVVRWAHRRDWLAYPQSNRWHAEPTALMGGIAVVGAATLGLLLSGPPVDIQVVWGAALLLFGVGVVDDQWGVGPATKLTVQVIATGLLLYAGFAFGRGWPLWVSLPLTLLWVVGITNAINLLDNMDGLAAGIAGIAALVMAAFAGLTGHGGSLAMAAALGGAALGFLVFNFKPAHIFMGDCGSLFLGFGIAALGLIVQQQTSVGGPVAVALVPLAVLAIPILDTTLVTVVRSWAGRPVSQGGRDHTSHRLVFLGLSETHAVLMLYGLSLLSGGLALALLFVDVTLFYALSGFVGIGLAVVGVHLARANVYRQGATGGDGAPRSTPRPFRVLHALFGRRWKAVFGVLADAVLMGAAFVLAYHLRFEGELTEAIAAQFMEALPLVVAGQIAVFAAMGMYRGIWRHAGTPELVRTVAATAGAMMPTAGVWWVLHGGGSLSVSVLVIDWMVVTLAAIGVRFGFRGLRQYFAAHRSAGRRVLLYGAGDAGVLTLRALRRNPDLSRTPVGFLDDDPLKQNQTVQGLPVVGTGDDLVAVCAAHDVEEVIVTTEALPPSRRTAVREACRAAGIGCTAFDVTFRPMDDSVEAKSSPVSAAV
jgi:UDP-GlcNAc:undecaprenyl-phosphate GlcNAc-1-phosphate transferase